MPSSESIVLHPAVDSHDLGPQHIDLHLFPEHCAAGHANGAAHAVRAHLTVATPDGPTPLTIMHPAHEEPMAVAPGLIQVLSARGSSLSLYNFGSTLSTVAEPDLSTGRLESTAPILWVNKSFYDNDLNPVDLVMDEFEAWLSVLRARSAGNLAAFYRQLQQVSAFTLYLQALILAERTLGEVQIDERSERYWRSHQVIHGALNAARARAHDPIGLANLEQILRVERLVR